MNIVDIVILCCFIPAIYTGITNGFIRQLFSLVALFAGGYVACRFSSLAAIHMERWLSTDPKIMQVLAFLIIFIIIILVVNLIGRGIQSILKVSLLGWLDRSLGVLFSLIKSGIIISILIVAAEALDKSWKFLPDKEISESVLYTPLKNTATSIFPYVKRLL